MKWVYLNPNQSLFILIYIEDRRILLSTAQEEFLDLKFREKCHEFANKPSRLLTLK